MFFRSRLPGYEHVLYDAFLYDVLPPSIFSATEADASSFKLTHETNVQTAILFLEFRRDVE